MEVQYCTRCNADLTLQKGYRNDLPYWVCLGCGEMLINPDLDTDSDIVWICDNCGAMMNIQPGFSEDCGVWTCTECGFENRIDPEDFYLSEDEYQASLRDPYRGLSDDEALELLQYPEEGPVGGREDIILVRHMDTGKRYVKKLLTTYDKSIYAYLREHPVAHMPRIEGMFEGSNCLIVLEEYIEGKTVEALLEEGVFPEAQAVRIVKRVCAVLRELHGLPKPIIHRDVKPSNIIVAKDEDVYLLDMNVARWHDPEKNDDTRHMGTQYFAAPEQMGFGLSSSSAKSDIYAAGILFNVMLTGCIPKEKRAEGPVWDIIARCIRMDPEDRFTAAELAEALDRLGRV